MALELVRKGVFPSTGLPSYAGIPNMPAHVWLFALPCVLITLLLPLPSAELDWRVGTLKEAGENKGKDPLESGIARTPELISQW